MNWVGALGVLIPIAALLGGITCAIFAAYFNARTKWERAHGASELRAALDASTRAQTDLSAKVDALANRLQAIETTLSSIR